jgi:hypothetical protein
LFFAHYQNAETPGHTLYRSSAVFFAPNILEMSESPCATNGQFGYAVFWDAASLFDPVGLSDVINAYSGLDGGRGGMRGVIDYGIDMAPILNVMPTDPIKKLY